MTTARTRGYELVAVVRARAGHIRAATVDA